MIDVNCDMGEGLSLENSIDDLLMPFVSSCNVACGFHSGSPEIIEKTIQLAILNKVKIGAHPSYNDAENFGRKSIEITETQLMAEIKYQICAIKGIVESFGEKLHHVKLHGALYNDTLQNVKLAEEFVRVVKSIDKDLKIYAIAPSKISKKCKKHQLKFLNEAFVDRRYELVNRLINRNSPKAIITETNDVINQLKMILDNKVKLRDDTFAPVFAETVCFHSDSPNALEFAKGISDYLSKHKINKKLID